MRTTSKKNQNQGRTSKRRWKRKHSGIDRSSTGRLKVREVTCQTSLKGLSRRRIPDRRLGISTLTRPKMVKCWAKHLKRVSLLKRRTNAATPTISSSY